MRFPGVMICVFLLMTQPLRGEGAANVPVRVGKVIRGNLAAGKVFVGTVEAARRTTVGSAVAGRVEEVFVEEGDLVDPTDTDGGKLVQLRLRTVEIELASAAASLEVARQQLAELVAGPREEEIRRLAAEAQAAKAVREFASKNFDRLNELFARDATAKGNLEEALSSRIAAEQRYLAALAEHEAAVRGTRQEQLAQAQARVSKAEEEVNRLKDVLDNHTIRTPFRGYVTQRFAERGAWIAIGDPIAEVMQLDPVEVRVAVPAEFISRVKQDAEVHVAVASIRDQRAHVRGKVFRIIPSADARSRSFPVRVRIENSSLHGLPLLKPGMLARVTLSVGPSTEALLVPRDALVLDRNSATVFALPPSGETVSARQVVVRVGATQDAMVQVTPVDDELQAGMRVVVEGNERLSPEQTVFVLAD